MDERLKQALDFSKYQQTLTIQKKQIKERIDSKLTYGHNGGIFKIDRSLITFVQMLIDRGRTENIPILDTNETPVLITNLEEFRDEILDRYFTSLYEYYDSYEKIKKSRTVEKLIDYE
jgi:hypothetical protein